MTMKNNNPVTREQMVQAIKEQQEQEWLEDLRDRDTDTLTEAVDKGTPDTLNRAFKQAMKESLPALLFEGQPLLDSQGNAWTLYRIANNSLWGRATEEIRLRDMQKFVTEYSDDMLQSALTAMLDTDKLQAYMDKYKKAVDKGDRPDLTPAKLYLKAHFTVAQTAIKALARANHSINYIKRLNDDGTVFAPERAELGDWEHETDEGIQVYSYTGNQTLEARYSAHTGTTITVNPDVKYKGNTSFTDAYALAESDNDDEQGITSKELELVILLASLEKMLSPERFEKATMLLQGQVEWRKVSYAQRTAIREAFVELACL